MVDELITWTHPHLSAPDILPFTEVETLAMLRLPRKECSYFHWLLCCSTHGLLDLATPEQTRNTYLTLVTLLFAYVYDARFTQHDPTPESAWTTCTLVPAFSALDPAPYTPQPGASPSSGQNTSSVHLFEPHEVASSLTASYRRSLAYPLYRSWKLCGACRDDVANILARGKRLVLRCLLEMRAILDDHEVYYVYSRVWLDDFCSWSQSYARYVFFNCFLTADGIANVMGWSEDMLKCLGEAVRNAEMAKSMIGWDLESLEAAVDAAGERSSDSDDESEDEIERSFPSLI
jgi:protein SHQ1